VYRRGARDQPVSIGDINDKFGTSLEGSRLISTANRDDAGQSLGGGLAGIVSAQLNVKSYFFDPAPFVNQIRVQAAE
jgi:hypothetical protein